MKSSLLSLFLMVFVTGLLFFMPGDGLIEAQQIPMGQDLGGQERAREQMKTKESETQKLEAPKEEAKIEGMENVVPPEVAEKPPVPETKVLINKIEVTGVTVLRKKAIRAIVSGYEGKDLALKDFSEIAGKITDAYRGKGYVTSIAYLPPQKIENNVLKIEIMEGKVGKINIEGNKNFSRRLFKRYIKQKENDNFNYDALRSDLNYINQHPDRKASAVLVRGTERGRTDINMTVKDRLPLHATLAYNNYNSSYLEHNKYIAEIKCTNMFGLDHTASAEFQMGEAGLFYLYSGRYVIPLDSRQKIMASYIHIDQKLGRSVKNLDIKGRGDVISTFYSYKLIDSANFSLTVSPGFDYRQIENKILGMVQSRDNTRVAKLGLDADLADRFGGRNLVIQEFDWGIPGFLEGLKSKDPKGSRLGAGGAFCKFVTNAARMQTLPADLSLMVKGTMQMSTTSLVSSEQFNIGGIGTVRGYPVAQFSGDNGYNATGEVYVPPYFFPKKWNIPYTKTSFFDSLRFLGFFDWGLVTLRNPQVGEKDSEMLYSTGGGLRFTIPERCSVSVDYGYGLGQKPSEGSRSRVYIEAKVFF